MAEEIAIRVEHVSKDFVLPHEKVQSVKGLFTGLARGHFGKTKEVQHALKDVSFEVKKGEFFGIVGRNGSGKSTLLKILAGIYQPTSGSVATHGKLVPFIELGVGFNPELTGRENVYLNGAMLGFSEKEISAMYDDIVAFAELEQFMDQKLKNYSSGMQVRLAFSMATRSEADILLVDEVLAVGDADFQRKCFDYFRKLKKIKKTVVFVTHDMNAVREYCDRAMLIEKSKVIVLGESPKVASAYTRMFMEEANKEGTAAGAQDKWGDQKIVYKNVEVVPTTVYDEHESIIIKATALAKENVNRPLFGFLIKSASGFQLLGTNNDIKRKEIDKLKKGQRVDLEWKIPNVFGDGKHYIDLAAEYESGHKVAERWDEALEFDVFKEERTPYVISPLIEVELKVS